MSPRSDAAVGHVGPRVRLNPGLATWGWRGADLSESDFRARQEGRRVWLSEACG